MKIQLLALPLVALLPACALAQTQALPSAPRAKGATPIEPAAKALLDRAVANYKSAIGLRFRVSSTLNSNEVGTSHVLFSRPNRLLAERQSGKNNLRLLLNGSDFYVVQGTSYRKSPVPPVGASQLLQDLGSTSAQMISAMLDGKNPIEVIQSEYLRPPFQGFTGITTALSPRVLDGDVLSGVQSNATFTLKGRDGSRNSYGNQVTAWFGGSPFALRRVQTRYMVDGKTVTLSEKIFEQELSPNFGVDDFKFNDKGLKPAPLAGHGNGGHLAR